MIGERAIVAASPKEDAHVARVDLAARDERYRRLNDVICVCVGEVRRPANPAQPEPDLVIDVAEPVWEPIGE